MNEVIDYRRKNRLSPEVQDLRAKIQQTGLSYRQVYVVVGVSKGWFSRMIRGDYLEPNPEWMSKIDSFLIDFLELVKSYK